MKKPEKQSMIDLLQGKFARSNLAVVAEFSGMSVTELQEVKNRLRAASGEFKVVKNTLAARAVVGTPVAALRPHLKGQMAVAFGYGDPVAAAQALKQISGKQKKLKLMAGVMEGQVIDLPGLSRIADLPSRPVLYGQLVNRMKSPLFNLAGGLRAIVSKWVRTLAAVHEKRSASSSPDGLPR